MRTTTYVLTYFAFLVLSTGILFKIQHWPGSSVMLLSGHFFAIIAGAFMLAHKLRDRKNSEDASPISAGSGSTEILDDNV